MAQNVYDDPEFFTRYSQLRRSVEGLAGAPEWPALRSLLPPLTGLRVIDLGCGFGWFCRWAADEGAAQVIGIDLSENMLARARETAHPSTVLYERHDLDTVELPTASFDVAYSSLTLHYLTDLDRLCATLHAALVPDGTFVCSIEHPVYTAPSRPSFVTDDSGSTVWPLDGYLREGPRTTDWLAPGVVKQHRTVATYLSTLIRHGFTITALDEWGPTAAQIAETPEWAVERERPAFLLIRAVNRPSVANG